MSDPTQTATSTQPAEAHRQLRFHILRHDPRDPKSEPHFQTFELEEAAGITRYKARKHEAELKLEHTRQNLLRLDDVIGEVNRSLRQIKRQARQAEQHQRGQTLRIGLHHRGVATFTLQRLQQKTADLLVTDARDHGAFESQTRSTEGDVGRAAAQIFGKAAGILKMAADLLRV